jgi:hypothetical protein
MREHNSLEGVSKHGGKKNKKFFFCVPMMMMTCRQPRTIFDDDEIASINFRAINL